MQQYEEFQPIGQPLRVSCTVEKEELFDSLVLQQRAHGQGKRFFQMAFALVLAFGMFYSWLRDSSYTMGLTLGIICILLFFALFLLPGFIMKHTAQMMAENLHQLDFQIYENGISVFDGLFTTAMPCEELAVYENDKMVLFETKSQRLYPLLKRNVDPLEKKILSQLLCGYPVYYVFSEAGGARGKQ